MAQAQSISFSPETFTEGGFLDDVDVEIMDAKFMLYDYQGKSERGAVPVLHMGLKKATDGEVQDQYWSVGDADSWQPTTDGKGLIPIKGQAGLNKNTRAAMLFSSLVDSGLDVGVLEAGDISLLIGYTGHIVQVPAPVFGNDSGKDAKGRQKTFPIFTTIEEPKEAKGKGGGRGKAAPKGKGKTTTKAAKGSDEGSDDGDVVDAAVSLIMELLAEADGGPVAKKALAPSAYQKLRSNPNKAEVAKLLLDDAFLGDEDHPWTMDGNELSM